MEIWSPLPPYDLTGGRIIATSNFGPRGPGFHYGLDLGSQDGIEIGTTLHAVEAGVIENLGSALPNAAGIFLWLRGVSGVGWKYFHMNNLSVVKGQVVRAGDLVGHVGRTGTGAAHLHLQAHNVQQGGWGDNTAFNPRPLVEAAWDAGRWPGSFTTPPPSQQDWFDMATQQDLKDVLLGDDVQWALARSVIGFLYSEDMDGKGSPQYPLVKLFQDQDARVAFALAILAEQIRKMFEEEGTGVALDVDALADEIVSEMARRLND